MIAVDTNVLVRVLVDDPGQKAQVAAARSQAKRAGQVWVAQIVQAETVWVLESAYDLDRTTILRVPSSLGLHWGRFTVCAVSWSSAPIDNCTNC